MADETAQHKASIGVGNNVAQFVCCTHLEHPSLVVWCPPGGRRSEGVWYNQDQAYGMIVAHLTRDADRDELDDLLEAADFQRALTKNTVSGIAVLADGLPNVQLTQK